MLGTEKFPKIVSSELIAAVTPEIIAAFDVFIELEVPPLNMVEPPIKTWPEAPVVMEALPPVKLMLPALSVPPVTVRAPMTLRLPLMTMLPVEVKFSDVQKMSPERVNVDPDAPLKVIVSRLVPLWPM